MLLSNSNEKLSHEVTTLHERLSAYQVKNAAQAEIIKAQRVNLDAARKAIREVLEPYCQCWNCKVLRAALEGVEPEDLPMAE